LTCGDCVDKLARKLLAHHPQLDMIRAYELADKAIERYERTEPLKVELKSGNPTDYTQTCTKTGSPSCKSTSTDCTSTADCRIGIGTCACACPAPLPNSHQETPCSVVADYSCLCNLILEKCRYGTCAGCVGTCGYECDAGYVWNPVTLTCDLVPVVGGSGQSSAALSLLAVALADWLRRKRRKRLVVVSLG